MKNRHLPVFVIATILAVLSGCSGPESPQGVTQAFWGAAVKGDADDVADYSTLVSAEDYDGFSREWEGYVPTWGKVVIDGDEASVVSRFSGVEYSEHRRRSFTTYLVRQDGEWLVDYERTAMSINGGMFGDLLKKFEFFSRDFSRQFDQSTAEAGTQMEQMLEELESAGQSLGEQANEVLEKYSDELRRTMEELDETLQRTLEERREQRRADEHQEPRQEPQFI